MSGAAEAVERVRQGPAGPRIGAFFDLDGTLVQGHPVAALNSDRARSDAALAELRGQTEDALTELGEQLFADKVAVTMRPEARDLVRAHRRMGHTLVIVSSATRYQIEPLARDLGIEHVVCTQVEVDGGILTGGLAGPILCGEPKAAAVREFARSNNIDCPASYAYANGAEDVPFLASVGNPSALNPDPALATAARSQSWPIVTLREPIRPGLRALLRSAGAMTALNACVGLGFAISTVRRDPTLGRSFAVRSACDSALAIVGVRLNVVGESNLWARRPALFVANHQSTLDVVVLGSLVRRDFTAVAKKEARYDPRIILGGYLLDMAFIDRSDLESAKHDMNALIERIRSGTSVIVLPEGTRSPTPTVGRFKKGAFHLAMQAGVPIVPVVIRNAGELMRRHSIRASPGTLDVAVLEPIPTEDWRMDDLDAHVANVRCRFVDTLDNWPTSEL